MSHTYEDSSSSYTEARLTSDICFLVNVRQLTIGITAGLEYDDTLSLFHDFCPPGYRELKKRRGCHSFAMTYRNCSGRGIACSVPCHHLRNLCQMLAML